MSRFRWLHLLLIALLSAGLLVACGGDDGDDPDNDVTDMAEVSDTDGDADADEDTDDASDADVEETSDTSDADDAADESELPDEPLRFTVIQPIEVRELVYLRGDSTTSIVYPGIQVLVETALSDEPVPGVEVAWEFPFPGSRATPVTQASGDNGRTPDFELTLAADYSSVRARIQMSPHLAGTEARPQDLKEIEASGMDVSVELPAAPIVGDGSSVYPVTFSLTRSTGGTEILPDDMALEIELVDNQGTPPLLFEGSLDTTREFTIDQNDPNVTVNFQSSAAGEGQLRYFLRLKQLGSSRGQRLEMIDIQAP